MDNLDSARNRIIGDLETARNDEGAIEKAPVDELEQSITDIFLN
jgi:hypothetical protein